MCLIKCVSSARSVLLDVDIAKESSKKATTVSLLVREALLKLALGSYSVVWLTHVAVSSQASVTLLA